MKYFLGVITLLLSQPVFPSTQTGKVTSILVRSDGLHWFYVNGPRDTRPTCSKSNTYWMIKDENTAYGRSQLSMLLTAFTSGKNVKIIGDDTCTRWGDGEDVRMVQIY